MTDDTTKDPENFVDDVTVRRGTVAVTFEWIGEGLDGDYDETDPKDEPMMRFTVYDREEEVENASYCTQMPANVDQNTVEAAAWSVLDAIYDRVKNGDSVKKELENLSWISPETIRAGVDGSGPPDFPETWQYERNFWDSLNAVQENASNDGCDPGLHVTSKSAVLALEQNLNRVPESHVPDTTRQAAQAVVASASDDGCDPLADLTVVEGLDELEQARRPENVASFNA